MFFKFELLFITIALCFTLSGQNLSRLREEDQEIPFEYVNQISDYPYIVSLEFISGGHVCCGTIIHKYYILIAAHCVAACDGECSMEPMDEIGKERLNVTMCVTKNCTFFDSKTMWIRAGTTKLHYGGVIIKDIEKFYVHKLNNMYYSHDIGLIQLKNPIVFTENVKPISLADIDDFMPPRSLATVLEFNFPIKKPDKLLKKSNLQILHNEVCSHEVKRKAVLENQPIEYTPIEDSHVCVGHYGIICESDIGAPLVYNGKLYGIATMLFKGKCSSDIHISLYVRITSVRKWIDFYIEYGKWIKSE